MLQLENVYLSRPNLYLNKLKAGISEVLSTVHVTRGHCTGDVTVNNMLYCAG